MNHRAPKSFFFAASGSVGAERDLEAIRGS
jgi:hypothetical protein